MRFTISPLVLYSGEIELEAKNPPETGYSGADIQQASFDFDTNKTAVWNSKENDLVFGLTIPNPDSYLVLGPSSGAKGMLEKNGQLAFTTESGEFSFQRCFSAINKFGYGGIPIPAIGSCYCWLTNEGRMVEFVIAKIENLSEPAGAYRIEIRYTVWDPVISK